MHPRPVSCAATYNMDVHMDSNDRFSSNNHKGSNSRIDAMCAVSALHVMRKKGEKNLSR